MLILHVLLQIILLICIANAEEHEIPKFKRGPIVVVDETALTNPNSFDYDFSEDLNKPVDDEDLYDQFIDQLPHFNIYKLGKDKGVTEVPIVTRKWETWFTPSTLSNREEKFTWFATTPMTPKDKVNEVIQTTTTTRRPTTPRKPKTTTTTVAPTTTSTTPSTTTSRTTRVTTTTQAPTTTTTRAAFVNRNQLRVMGFRQPRPVFRENPTTTTTQEPVVFNRGPVWRRTGVVFESTTTQRSPTPRTWTRRVFAQRVPTTTSTTTTAAPVPETTTQFVTRGTTMGTRWVVGPRHPPRVNQNWRQPIRQLQQSLGRAPPPTHTDPLSRSLPKPVVIQNPTNRYSGPTYNCRVLNPFTDGTPSDEHDSSCKMLYPGLSMDGSCRCFYKVAGRDSHGCATGFIYACRQLHLRSVSV